MTISLIEKFAQSCRRQFRHLRVWTEFLDPAVKRLDRCTTLEWLPADGKPQAGAGAKAGTKGEGEAKPK